MRRGGEPPFSNQLQIGVPVSVRFRLTDRGLAEEVHGGEESLMVKISQGGERLL
jgi:hypothetical protein